MNEAPRESDLPGRFHCRTILAGSHPARRAQRGVPRSGLWSEGNDCVERNGSERAQVASVAERKPPASPER